MPYKENLKRATDLKQELDDLRPLSADDEKRIMQKFRLDWNFHSSNIEGNNLTYGETKALLLFGTTAQHKPLHDHLEMKGHNEAILWIEEVIKEQRPLNETFLWQLHELILKEPYEVDAITPDGKPTKRMISIGKYKSVPNHVQTKTGEMFFFASVEETPAKMHDLLEWYKKEKENPELQPVLFASEFHYRFIRIHPFDDGNGRMARLLMNFILMQFGYPPAVVKTEDKENYFVALQQADAGDLAFFFNYICEQVNHSLDLMIRGAKGEDIDEENDLDKRLALLKQEVESEDDDSELKEELSFDYLRASIGGWCDSLINEIDAVVGKFKSFYKTEDHKVTFYINNSGRTLALGDENIAVEFINDCNQSEGYEENLSTARIEIEIRYGPYYKSGLTPFVCNYNVNVRFERYDYEIEVPEFKDGKNRVQYTSSKRLLHNDLNDDEIKSIRSTLGDTLYKHLELHLKELKHKKNDN